MILNLSRPERLSLFVLFVALAPAGDLFAAAPPQKTSTDRGVRTDSFGDSLPFGTIRRLGTVRLHHPRWANAISFFRDGKTLTTGGGDGFVRFWDVGTAKSLPKNSLIWIVPRSAQ
jgi:WD40 repeat protein